MKFDRIKLAGDTATGVCGPLCRASGSRPTPDDLALINKSFALEPFAEDELYLRTIWAINNTIFKLWSGDARLRSETIADLARTFIGKHLMLDHSNSVSDNIGVVFKTDIVTESLEQARERTGANLRLPEGEETVEWLVARFYISLRSDDSLVSITKKIDDGVIKYASCQFDHAAKVPVHEEGTDKVLYHELPAPAEAVELSLVYLGAVPGTAVVEPQSQQSTQLSHSKDNEKTKTTKEKQKMKDVKAMLGLSTDASDEAVAEAVKKLQGSDSDTSELMKTLDVSTAADAVALKAAADDGHEYRESVLNALVAAEVKLERITADKQDERKKQLASRSLSEIKTDRNFLEKQIAAKFPSKAQMSDGGDPQGADETGKDYLTQLDELKEGGLSHYDAVMKLHKTRPGAFIAHVAASMKGTLN